MSRISREDAVTRRICIPQNTLRIATATADVTVTTRKCLEQVLSTYCPFFKL